MSLFDAFGFRRNNPGSASTPINTKDLNLQALPILSAHELLTRQGIDTRLRDWRTLIGSDDAIFDPYIQEPFFRYAEAVQLCPASESDHHAGPGGLLVHTYDVITLALKKRRGLQLPKGGSVDQINAQRHLWTYAVFAAGLLHDIGKLLGSIRIVLQLNNGKELVWTPHDQPIKQIKLVQSYRIEFVKTPYSYHTQVALTLFDFLPIASRAWLARDPVIMMQLCAYLRGDRFESGVIGDILESADMSSTAAAQLRPDSQRFSNKASTIERLVHFVRNWLAEGDIKVNKNGGMAWVDEHGHIYIVCRALADKIIRHCDDLGITDLPRDPVRLYDIFQDYGFALPTVENRAIWNVQISCAEYTHHFTCLKFDVRRLFVPTRLPIAFDGSILDESALKRIKKPQSPNSESQLAAKTISQETESNQETGDSNAELNDQKYAFQEAAGDQETAENPETAKNPEAVFFDEAELISSQETADSLDLEKIGGEGVQSLYAAEDIPNDHQAESQSVQDAANFAAHEFDSSPEEADEIPIFRDTIDPADHSLDAEDKTHTAAQNSHALHSQETAVTHNSEAELTANQEAAPIKSQEAASEAKIIKTKFSKFSISGEAVFEPGAVSMENEQLQRMFLQWLRLNLIERKITYNKPDALVHFFQGNVLLLGPAIFVNFLVLHGLDGPKEHHKLSKRFGRLKLNIKSEDGMHLNSVYVSSNNKTSRIWVWKLPANVIFDNPDDVPADNKFISSTPDIK